MGGYESILKKITPGNFNWFLHSMLFYHTKHVITNKRKRQLGQIIVTVIVIKYSSKTIVCVI